MAIVYNGKVARLQVKPGKEGQDEFKRQIRRIFNLPDSVELDCTFDCKAPGTGERLKLHGMESYSAAMHCASIAAGERLAHGVKAQHQHQREGVAQGCTGGNPPPLAVGPCPGAEQQQQEQAEGAADASCHKAPTGLMRLLSGFASRRH